MTEGGRKEGKEEKKENGRIKTQSEVECDFNFYTMQEKSINIHNK